VLESRMILMDEPMSELCIKLVIDDTEFRTMRIYFRNESEETSSRFAAKIENHELIMECINFNSALGTGTENPMRIGEHQGKRLMLHLWSYMLGNESVRKVEYTIFREM